MPTKTRIGIHLGIKENRGGNCAHPQLKKIHLNVYDPDFPLNYAG